MNRTKFAETLGVTINTPKNWFGHMKLKTPETYDGNHVVLCEIYKKLSSIEPKLSQEQIIESCIPFMRAANVTPVDPATHPLTAGSATPGSSASSTGEGESPFAALVAETMEGAAVDLAAAAALGFLRGLKNRAAARDEFKAVVSGGLRVGIGNWVRSNSEGVKFRTVEAATEEVLPATDAKGALPESEKPAEKPAEEGKA